MKQLLKYFINLTILFFALSAQGEPKSTLRFNGVGFNEGFLGQTFYTTFQDSDNFMWIGGDSGLYCWDGYRMKYYFHEPTDSTSISASRVNAISEIGKNKIAVATINGVNIFDKLTERFSVLNFSKGTIILSMVLDDNGRLWLGTNKGVYCYDFKTKKERNFNSTLRNTNEYFPGNYVICLARNEKTVIAGTEGYLSFFDPFSDKFVSYEMPIKCGLIISAIKSKEHEDKYWVGTDDLLFLWDKKTNQCEVVMTNKPIKNMVYDKSDNLWIGTDNGLLSKPSKSQDFHSYTHDIYDRNSVSSNIVLNCTVDKESNLWLSTTNGVVISSLKQKVVMYPIKELFKEIQGMQFFFVTVHGDDVILAGTGGLVITNNKTSKSIWLHTGAQNNHRLSHNRTRFVYPDSDGVYWIATDLGLNSFDTKTNTTRSYNIIEPSRKYKSDWMYHIAEKDGMFYLSTYDGGVFVVKKSDLINSKPYEEVVVVRHYSSTSSVQPIKSNIITSVVFDDENLYFVTDSEGICKVPIDESKPVQMLSTQNNKIASDFIVRVISLDTAGFAVAYNKKVEIISSKGVRKTVVETTSTINYIDVIDDKYMCVNTFGELYLVNMSNGNYKSVTTQNLGIAPIQSVFYDKASHLLYCGGIDSYGTIEVSDFEMFSESVKPVITNLLLNAEVVVPSRKYKGRVVLQKPIYNTEEITLESSQNTFSLEFSSLLFSPMSPKRFVYRLRGLSNEWVVNSMGNNKASFINVPPGKYVFEVLIQDSSNIDPQYIKSIKIIVKPPLYLSTGAWILYFIIFIGIVILVSVYLKKRQKDKIVNMEREQSLTFSQMKIDFLTNTSHELKTPLSLIIAKLSNLIVNEKNPDKRQKLLSIHNSAEQIKNLTMKNLRQGYQTEGLKIELHLKAVDIVEFTRSICEAFNDKFAEKSIEFSFVKPKDPIYVMLDSGEFCSVVENLVSNAIKFTPENGRVKVVLSVDNNVERVYLSVSDTGCGVDPQKQPFIFDRFYKASYEAEGHGLGLAITREIVVSHSGEISLISAPGMGSEFVVSLPVVKYDLHITTKGSSMGVDKNSVLIVEDNIEMLDFIAQGLAENFNCLKATNVTEGFRLAIEYKPSLIVTDLMLPDFSGNQLVEKVRQNMFIASTPIIMLTACSDKASEIESYSKGVDAYMSKPFDMNDLAIRAWQLIRKNELQYAKIRQQTIAQGSETKVVSQDDKFIESITKIIEDQISDNDLSVSVLSKKCAMSEKQIYRRIKQLSGLTPTEYVRQIRLNRASLLLKQGGFSVSEVLFMVGFSNPSYFTKCFKAQFNVTPSEYLEANKEKK